jgi:hypothetical protein
LVGSASTRSSLVIGRIDGVGVGDGVGVEASGATAAADVLGVVLVGCVVAPPHAASASEAAASIAAVVKRVI